jgi:uncharacterized lipoprotein YddW (UPF0748 family)
MKITDKPKIAQAFRWRNGAYFLGRSIVIVFLVAFQLGLDNGVIAWASPRLHVFQMNGSSLSVSEQHVLKTIGAAGYKARLIQEEDLLFHLKLSEMPYLLVPLSSHIQTSSFDPLTRYLAVGGRLIFISSGELPDPSFQKLLQGLGLNVTGTATASEELKLYWQGASLPGGDSLMAGNQVLTFQSGLNEEVIANWGQQYPAIINTPKGALLNWPRGQSLSKTTVVMALTKLMPMARPDSIVFAESTPSQASRRYKHNAFASSEKNVAQAPAMKNSSKGVLSPDYIYNQAILGNKASRPEGAHSLRPYAVNVTNSENASDNSALKPNASIPPKASSASKPNASIPPKASSASKPNASIPPKASSASKPNASIPPKASSASKPDASIPPKASSASKPNASIPPKASSASKLDASSSPKANLHKESAAQLQAKRPHSASSKKTITSEQSEAETEAEVLGNILGTSQPEGKAPATKKPLAPQTGGGAETSGATPNPASGRSAQPQKPFSFLDPEAAEVLAPEFDYGTYSYNLRILDDYNRRINDALETSRQLSLEVPEEKIRAMLKDAYQHKRKFESLYLGNQTQAGLDQFAEARRLTLRALALTSASPRVEGRAIWLDRGTILEAKNPQELKKMMLKLRQAGINIVYFETLNAGFPIYPSAILAPNPLVQGWDPLKVAVEEGHQLGMEVHAWVWVFAVGNQRHNPLISRPASYPGPVLMEGGLMSEALRARDGSLQADNRQHEYWLDPASEKGRSLLLKVYEEIVSQYNVDGLQLDYIRYPFQTSATLMGFDSAGRDRFYQATGQSLDRLDDNTAKLWIAWKTSQVSSFVRQVSERLRKIKPNLMISAAVFPMRRESRIVAIQQDWETWIDNGWVDTLSPMSYTSDPQRLQGMFDYVRSSPRKRSLIYPGIALHRLDGGQLVQQLEALRQHGGLGATLFAGAHLDQEKIETLGTGPYKEQTSIPPHRDVVKSLQIILADYSQKFNTLQAKGALANLSGSQTQDIQASLGKFKESLTALSAFKTTAQMPEEKLMAAQQSLSALQLATDPWLQSEVNNRFRAQYFNQKMQLLDGLLGYLLDKNKLAIQAPRLAAPELTVKNPQ